MAGLCSYGASGKSSSHIDYFGWFYSLRNEKPNPYLSESSLMRAKDQLKLKAENLSLTFGSIQALMGISLDVYGDKILALIGPNGARKTCLLNCISGFYHPQKGKSLLDGKDIIRLSPSNWAKIGISRTF
jgi:ABC-type uncharacterized transport system ATPase subunit